MQAPRRLVVPSLLGRPRQVPSGPGRRLVAPDPVPPAFPDCFAWGQYTGPLRAGIRSWKDGGRRDLDRGLAVLLASAIADALRGPAPGSAGGCSWAGGPVLIVTVPSSARAVRLRGDRPLERRDARMRSSAWSASRGRVHVCWGRWTPSTTDAWSLTKRVWGRSAGSPTCSRPWRWWAGRQHSSGVDRASSSMTSSRREAPSRKVRGRCEPLGRSTCGRQPSLRLRAARDPV